MNLLGYFPLQLKSVRQKTAGDPNGYIRVASTKSAPVAGLRRIEIRNCYIDFGSEKYGLPS